MHAFAQDRSTRYCHHHYALQHGYRHKLLTWNYIEHNVQSGLKEGSAALALDWTEEEEHTQKRGGGEQQHHALQGIHQSH